MVHAGQPLPRQGGARAWGAAVVLWAAVVLCAAPFVRYSFWKFNALPPQAASG